METDYKSFMTGKGDKSKNITVITKKLRHVLFYYILFRTCKKLLKLVIRNYF